MYEGGNRTNRTMAPMGIATLGSTKRYDPNALKKELRRRHKEYFSGLRSPVTSLFCALAGCELKVKRMPYMVLHY